METLKSIKIDEIKFNENTLLRSAEDLEYADGHENDLFKDEKVVFNKV